jgi:hypothetical protein
MQYGYKMLHIRMACLLLALARKSSAQSSNSNVSTSIVAVVSLLGAAGGLIFLSFLVSSAWKRYKTWRDEPVLDREHAIGQLNLQQAPGNIPLSDIQFQGADLYRLLDNDTTQTTPRSFGKMDNKRWCACSYAMCDSHHLCAPLPYLCR